MGRGISETDRGMLASGMSDASVALMLGRTAAWVARTRQAMATPAAVEGEAAGGGPAEVVVAPGPAALEQLSIGDMAVEVTPEIREAVAATGAAPVAAVARALDAPRPRPQPDGRPVTVGADRIEILKPVTPRVVGWARRFAAAGWDLADVAGLFDVEASALAAAVEGGLA